MSLPKSVKFPDRNYLKIQKIGPGAYIFQRPFLRDLFSEGNLHFKIDWLACSGKEIYHFCFVLLCIQGPIPSIEGQFNGGFFA